MQSCESKQFRRKGNKVSQEGKKVAAIVVLVGFARGFYEVAQLYPDGTYDIVKRIKASPVSVHGLDEALDAAQELKEKYNATVLMAPNIQEALDWMRESLGTE